ncbi:MAG TPA: 4-hydroxythreonine-4-phosphate dehydrogenase PdxA [Azospirillaceae bacterium]|nr:4-hydroxythreonine-4-phosphate dehydrogenase PdxA [Azospirillaceae bacterium]
MAGSKARRSASAGMEGPAPLALTMGEPAGIGGELTLMAWAARRHGGRPFVAVDDPARLADLARRIGLDCPVLEIAGPEDGPAAFGRYLPVVPLSARVDADPGRPDPRNAAAVVESIERCVAFASSGRAAAVVTNPIAKSTLYGAGFRFPGHTEFLASLAGVPRTVMLLACPGLRVVPVTVHVPLSSVPGLLTADLIVETAVIVDAALRRDFGVAAPRLAVAGLNPHAGEGGALGTEDRDVVAPAVERLRARGIDAAGPLPADTMFHGRARDRYDAALCMYHDQALIPLKTIGFDDGVNVTLGLPFVRTSPDHGTAFDLAGTGRARPDSLLAALDAAHAMAVRRAGGGIG